MYNAHLTRQPPYFVGLQLMLRAFCQGYGIALGAAHLSLELTVLSLQARQAGGDLIVVAVLAQSKLLLQLPSPRETR